MQVFSKPIIENATKNILKDNSEKEKIITYADYYNKKIVLKKYKLPELKSIVKPDGLFKIKVFNSCLNASVFICVRSICLYSPIMRI